MTHLRPTRAEVDLRAIAENVCRVRERIGWHRKMLVAVKADAYGHGAVPCASAMLRAGAEALGVASTDEGIELREANLDAPILILGPVFPEEAEPVVACNLTATVTDLEVAQAINEAGRRQGRKARVHLKVDTGMGRLGVWHEEAAQFGRKVAGHCHLFVEGLFTHFPTSDGRDKGFAREQVRRFMAVVDDLAAGGLSPPLLHAANSGAIFDLPESYFNLVRPGLMLYGARPSEEVESPLPLSPAMSFKTRIAFLKDVPAGRSIGYGRTHITERPTVIATLPVGYADGFPRTLSNRGEVLVRGLPCRVLGRVCMDQCMIDVTDVPGVGVGDEAVLFGEQRGAKIPVERIAGLIGTIPNEVLCAVSKRVPRVYIN